MKKLLKIFGYFALSILILTIILVVTASLSQKKIVDIALKKISESTKAPIEIEELSFTFIKRFPLATIELSGVRVGAEESIPSNSTSKQNEDIINIKSVFVSVKTMPLFRGEFDIIKVEIDDATLNYKVDSLGCCNIDFLTKSNEKDTSVIDTSGAIPALNLRRVKLKNTTIFYVDDQTQTSANLLFPALDVAGKFADENFTGNIKGDLQLTKCSFGNTHVNQLEKALFKFKLDYKADTLQIKSLEANTDGVQLLISGKAAIAKNIFTDLTFETKNLELGKLLKYVPNELLNEYGIEDINGIMSLSGTAKGIVNDSVMPVVDVAIDLKNGTLKTKDYPIIKKIDFAGDISNGSERNNKTTSLIFKSFHAETDSSSVEFTLSLNNFDKPKYTLNSKLKITIEEFKDFIPDTLAQNISGKFIAELSTEGELPDSIDDNFINYAINNSSANIDFSKFNIEMDSISVKDFSGSIIYKPGQLVMNNLKGQIPAYKVSLKNTSFNAEFTGPITQLQNLGINFNSFYAEAAQGKVWGSAKIENLEHPDFVINANASVNLAELKPFIPDTLVKNISGDLTVEISSYGKLNLDSIAEQINNIVFKQSKIKLDAKNISATLPDTLQKLTNFSGLVKVVHDTISISKMKGVAAGMDFSIDAATITNVYNTLITHQQDVISISKMSGVAAGIDFLVDSATIVNVYNTLIMNQQKTLSIYGIFNFGAIDYSMFAPFLAANSSENTINKNNRPEVISNQNSIKENTSDNKAQNFSYEFKGKIAAKSFKYEKMLLEDISAKFNVSDSVYIIDQFRNKAFNGITNSAIRYSKTADGRQIVNVKTLINRIDITKFMYAFDNFGYDSLISYQNLSGLVSVELHSRFVFEADTFVTNDMRIMGDLTLENGRLINYQPAMDVANFTGIKELDDIDLKTLKSNIFLFKNQMYVPFTNVVSSSMDFSVFGMQSFGDNYEYHIQMHLGDVLKGKSNKLIEKQNSSGDEISKEDMYRNTVKIIYANIDGKAKTGFDSKKAQKEMELKIQVQQTMLDLIFHPKLVSFETGVK